MPPGALGVYRPSVFREVVFRSDRYFGRIGPLFFDLVPPGALGAYAPPPLFGGWYFGRRSMLAKSGPLVFDLAPPGAMGGL